jgi:ribonuclease HII
MKAEESRNRTTLPTLAYETQLWQAGYPCVAGVDEAGRGALAGPVVAAAVVLPTHCRQEGVWAAVRDSKLLRPAVRVELAAEIQSAAAAWAVGVIPAATIDEIGIATAARAAMVEAVLGLGRSPNSLTLDPLLPDYLLIDWVRLPMLSIPQICMAKADANMVSVAAASILAKVTRDRLMAAVGKLYPAYGFSAHKGYGVQAHLAALAQYGPCPEHRRSFAPVMERPSLFDLDNEPDRARHVTSKEPGAQE